MAYEDEEVKALIAAARQLVDHDYYCQDCPIAWQEDLRAALIPFEDLTLPPH